MFVAPIQVREIACGGMHTLVLTTHGRVYSWGCNDEAALGREGAENTPILVKDLPYPMTNVTAGDCHSIAYNTSLNLVYRWGLYRNILTGKIEKEQRTPLRIAEKVLRGLNLKKITSGGHHTLMLASGRAFGWGDPETGKIGRMLKSRNKNNQSLIIEAIGLKNVKDIFCSSDSSFAINETKNGVQHTYAWGLNNWGQLGIGHRENVCTPTEIKIFKGLGIKKVCGGAHHSLALTADGHIYSWGKNEDGQLGIGDTYSEYANKKKQEIMDIDVEERKLTSESDKLIKEAKEKGDTAGVKKLTASHKKSLKKLSVKRDKEEDIEEILYFTTPQKVDDLSDIFYIDSGATYNYAIGKRVKKEVKKTEEIKVPADIPNVPKTDEAKEKDDVKMKVDLSEPCSSQELKSGEDANMSDVKQSQSQNESTEKVEKPKEDAPKVEGTKTEEVKTVPENKVSSKNAVSAENKIITESKPTEAAAPEIDERLNVVYSWGIGNSYVLATKDEETQYKPYEVKQDMYKNLNPLSISCGTLHVVIKACNPEEKEEDFELDKGVHIRPDDLADEIKSELSHRKRKRKDMETDKKEGRYTIFENKESSFLIFKT